jgi:hypothetical protein
MRGANRTLLVKRPSFSEAHENVVEEEGSLVKNRRADAATPRAQICDKMICTPDTRYT